MTKSAEETVEVCDVALDPRKGGLEAVWTYKVLPDLQVGDAVVVPLGTRTELGYVLKIRNVRASELGFPVSSLRSPQAKVTGLRLPKEVVETVLFIAEETICSPATALTPATPPRIGNQLSTVWSLCPQPGLQTYSAVQLEILQVMRENQGILSETKGKRIPPAMLRGLKDLRKLGAVNRTLKLAIPAERKTGDPLLRLTPDQNRIDLFLQKDGKKRPAQALTVMSLQAAERGMLTAKEIKALAMVTETTIKALQSSGLLEEVEEHQAKADEKPRTPNLAQELAIDAIVQAVEARASTAFLLYGVTGSGKTEVYLQAAAAALRSGRKVLYLVPEIALAMQSIGQLRQRFGKSVAVLHSNLPEGERLQNWLKIHDGKIAVVLGARSALFAPIEDLGLIVIDEEHEQAYKQESAPRYHSKAVALKLSLLHQCPVVFGSATPSIESFYEAEHGEMVRTGPTARTEMTLLTLPERAASSKLPDVTILDLADGYRKQRPAILSDELKVRLTAIIDKGEQAILFLNRRAYAVFLACRNCGNSVPCPNCSVSLSFHRRDNYLRCHHCGYQQRPPDRCPHCGEAKLAPFGVGTEKVEEAIQVDFPNARVGRLDRDIAKRKGALEEILAGFRAGDLDVLVGTQIVAKGLDFPNVTLVGVIAADISLNLPDFRASERTFQLLSQVAGRAGRGTTSGTVVIQTLNPQHPAVVAAKSHDYLSFYEILLRERREAKYPPFKRLVNVLVSVTTRIRSSRQPLARRKWWPKGVQRQSFSDRWSARLNELPESGEGIS